MATRKRLSQEDSQRAALEAARELLIESGPQSLTLKAVAERVGRTHSNLLHHFGSAAGLQKALAGFLAASVCQSIALAVTKRRAGQGSARELVDLIFDAFGREGAGALASWTMVSGRRSLPSPTTSDPVCDFVRSLLIYRNKSRQT